MKKTLLIVAAIAALAGCATKNYGRQGDLTSFEKQQMTSREIDLEIAKVHGYLDHIQSESRFDGRSVLSFLGDFGIGNVMEKNAALEAANKRLTQLQAAKAAKAGGAGE